MEERTEYKELVFSGKDGEDYHLGALQLKTALSGKQLLEAITYPEVNPTLNKTILSIWLPPLGDSSLWAVQNCKLEKIYAIYCRKGAIERQSLTSCLFNNTLNMRYRREQNMADRVGVLESRFARLSFVETKVDDSNKFPILISALKDHREFKLLDTPDGVMKEDSQIWRYVSSLLI